MMKVLSLNEDELSDTSDDRRRRSPCHFTPIEFWMSCPCCWCAWVLVAAYVLPVQLPPLASQMVCP